VIDHSRLGQLYPLRARAMSARHDKAALMGAASVDSSKRSLVHDRSDSTHAGPSLCQPDTEKPPRWGGVFPALFTRRKRCIC
jgi:hypothetical protein